MARFETINNYEFRDNETKEVFAPMLIGTDFIVQMLNNAFQEGCGIGLMDSKKAEQIMGYNQPKFRQT